MKLTADVVEGAASYDPHTGLRTVAASRALTEHGDAADGGIAAATPTLRTPGTSPSHRGRRSAWNAPTGQEAVRRAQLFRAWAVRLDQNDIGGLRLDGANQLRTYVNGKRVSGNRAAIELNNRQEIAIVYGPPDSKATIPTNYEWPANL